ncbi:hypothetical protein TSAR_007789 [Trichomalopsis sarcophagae]|uniref:Uncharacterized protein n=1 Tax=Trichomalopsis sarcophagae TaxID=543379 RepID=A0A232FKM5_9HYME|nr:hypothetical protein TSAR_007789 [Trichomalopsis sarcophagae]
MFSLQALVERTWNYNFHFAWLGRMQNAGQAEGPSSVQVSSSSKIDECPQRSHPSDLGGKTLVSLRRPEGKG